MCLWNADLLMVAAGGFTVFSSGLVYRGCSCLHCNPALVAWCVGECIYFWPYRQRYCCC